MTILQLNVLCSFRSQWLELLLGSKLLCLQKCNPSFSWLICLFQIKMICTVYSKWLSTGTTLSSSKPHLTTALSSWLSSQILMCCVLREREHPQPTSTIPKYLFTSAKIAVFLWGRMGMGCKEWWWSCCQASICIWKLNWDSCRSVKEDTKAISETRSIASKSKIALPFSGKSNTSFDCKSAFTF